VLAPFDFIQQEISEIDAAQGGNVRLSVDTQNHWMLYLVPDWERFQFCLAHCSSLRPAKLPAPQAAPAFLPLEDGSIGFVQKNTRRLDDQAK
jgi:hypothetical protein